MSSIVEWLNGEADEADVMGCGGEAKKYREAAAIIGELPLTADDVVMRPNMDVWQLETDD